MNTIITNPRAHREAWLRAHPGVLIENGGLLRREDLARWACDRCMAPLDPDKWIKALGGPEGVSLCDKCAPETDYARCQCTGCST